MNDESMLWALEAGEGVNSKPKKENKRPANIMEELEGLDLAEKAQRIKHEFPNYSIQAIIETTGWKQYRYWIKPESERLKIKEGQEKYRNKCKNLITKAKKDLGGCKICGYNKCLEALEFHHIDSKQKDGNISRIRNVDKLNKEIDKCVLLCSNCHREFHAGMIPQKEIDK